MSRADALVGAGAAAGYVALSARWGRRADSLERQWFPVVNGDRGLPLLRVPQQLGTPWSLVATSCFLAARGHRVDALAALAALPVEKAVEVLSKKLLQKQRPVKVLPTRLLATPPPRAPRSRPATVRSRRRRRTSPPVGCRRWSARHSEAAPW